MLDSKVSVMSPGSGNAAGALPFRYTETQVIHAPLRVLAVDPGLSGAAALIGRGRFEVLRDFKTLRDVAGAVYRFAESEPDIIAMEGVRARPGQGVCSVWSFGRSTGVAEGACYVTFLGKDLAEVFPQRWQNFWREVAGRKKGEDFNSRDIAARLFPGQDVFKRVKDHNTADAVLIAAYLALGGAPS